MPDTNHVIDLNSDLGEGFGPWRLAPDDELMPLISSANIACGFHAGDPRIIEHTVQQAKRHGVGIGAHPGYPDRVGFGRRTMTATPDEVRTDVLYQVGAIAAFCKVAGAELQHVKAHGALYNLAVHDAATAEAIAIAVKQFDRDLVVKRMIRLVTDGVVETVDGTDLRLNADTICLHSDTPSALDIATALRQGFDAVGIAVRPVGAGWS